MKHVLLFGFSLAAAAPALARDAAQERADAQTILVTGSRLNLAESGQSISVMGAGELDAVQAPDLTRALERLPGVSISRDGGLGATTGVRVRGAESAQLLVLIDGVRVADHASPGGAYDLGNLLAGPLAKLELLRGSNSVVWGSQAIGGVLALTTRETGGGEASAEYGAYDTVTLNGSAGLVRDAHAISFNAGYVRSDSFSAQSAGTEADGFRQWQLSGKARLRLGEGLTLRASARHADSRLGIDLSGPDSPDVQFARETGARAGLAYESDDLSLDAGVSLANIARDYETGFGPSSFKGRSRRIDIKGRWRLPASLALDFGADSDWTEAESSFDPKQKGRLSSGHALLGYYGAGLTLAAGARLDSHDRFGSHWTFGANGSVALGGDVRLRASYGEGFKAPTLYQLYGSFVGTPGLRPEESKSYDAGIELGDRNASLHLAATLFRRDSRNLIDFDPNLFIYGNIARARAEGVELEAGGAITPKLRGWASYTHVKSRDLVLNRDLARRPRNLLSLGADWRTPLSGLELGADLRVSARAVEYDFPGNVLGLDGYTVLTLRATLPVTGQIEIFGRIENVTDEHYETSKGFNTPRRSAYVGARARF